jgi:hypothetical protein
VRRLLAQVKAALERDGGGASASTTNKPNTNALLQQHAQLEEFRKELLVCKNKNKIIDKDDYKQIKKRATKRS